MENKIQYEYPIELWNIIKSFILIPKVDKTKVNPHAICMKKILDEINMMNFEQEVNEQELLNQVLDNAINDENIMNILNDEILLENEDYLNIHDYFNNETCSLWKKLILFEDNTDREIKPYGLYSSLLIISNNLNNNYENLIPFVKFKFKSNPNYLDNYSSIYEELLCNKTDNYLNNLDYMYKLQRLNFPDGQLYAYEYFNMKCHSNDFWYQNSLNN